MHFYGRNFLDTSLWRLSSLPTKITIDSHCTIVISIKNGKFLFFPTEILEVSMVFLIEKTDRNYVFNISQFRVPFIVAVLFFTFQIWT